MNSAELLIDGFGRVSQNVHRTLKGLRSDALTVRLDPDANSIAWLIWHLTRNQDDHLADAFSGEQLWTSQGWADRFALPFDVRATGYGQSSAEVAAVQSSAAPGIPRRDDRPVAALPEVPHRRRPRPDRGPRLGPAGHPGRAAD